MRALGESRELLQGEPLRGFECTSRQERETTVVRRLTLVTAARRVGVYVKTYRDVDSRGGRERRGDEQAESEFLELQRIARAFAGADDVGVVRPVAFLPGSRAIVTLEASGTPLAALASRQARRWGRSLTDARLRTIGAKIAEWLHRFQSLSPPETISIDEVRRYCTDRLERLERGPVPRLSAREAARVRDRFDALAGMLTLDDVLAVDLHADFTMENILIDGERVTVLDFVGGRRGMRVHDLSHLVMQLDIAARKPWLDGGAIRQLQGAMLSAYDPALRRDSPAFQIALLANVLSRMVHRSMMGGSWLQRTYSSYLWRTLEQGVERAAPL